MKNRRILIMIFGILTLSGCNAPTSVQESSHINTTSTSSARFAAGQKAVKINTHINGSSYTAFSAGTTGSFYQPQTLPSALTAIPSPYPGYDGSAYYHPGVSAVRFFDVDGATEVLKPAWLTDFQLGITGLSSGVGACSTFGGSGAYDVTGYYRTSEYDCSASANSGTGSNTDQVFMRLVLNRDNSLIGAGENLLIQVEYQASALRLNSDGTGTSSPDDNLDQLWKVFWNTSLSSTSLPSIFSIFVPPNYGACLNNGSGSASAPGNCVSGYKGAPTMTKQIIIPLSAYPTMSVIQLSRLKARTNITVGDPMSYVNSFCSADSPLCLGIVVRSVMLMRI